MQLHTFPNAGIQHSNIEAPSSPLPDQWLLWRDRLRRRRLDWLVVWFLDAGQPLAWLMAQLLYVGTPLLGPVAGRLALFLESDARTGEFRRYLEDESQPSQQTRRGET